MTGGEQVASTAELAQAGGAPLDLADPIEGLRQRCKAFIENANMTSHARSMALPKLEEMIFWIRAGSGRG